MTKGPRICVLFITLEAVKVPVIREPDETEAALAMSPNSELCICTFSNGSFSGRFFREFSQEDVLVGSGWAELHQCRHPLCLQWMYGYQRQDQNTMA